jgi:hypothetical protein
MVASLVEFTPSVFLMEGTCARIWPMAMNTRQHDYV